MVRRRYNKSKKSKTKSNKSRKVRHSKENALSQDELLYLIDSAGEPFDKVIIILAGFQGMREGEIAHMHKSWIDFQKQVIRIPAEKKCNCYECIERAKRFAREDGVGETEVEKITKGIWTPKSQKSIRSIPLRYDVPCVREVLPSYFKMYRDIGCSRQTIYNHILDVAKNTTITKKVHPHSLRATAGSLWGMMNISAPTLCAMMGWEDIQTANKYVTAGEESALQEARWRMGL